tara:strand:+ start:84 stop:470 length:387 start_codon:yes stop_codon:yes gene_type:complete
MLRIALFAVIQNNGKFIIMADAGYRGQAYGKAKEQEEALSAVPMEMGATPPRPVIPGGEGDMTRPSQYPQQSVMAPASIAPRSMPAQTSENVARILPSLLPLASSPYAAPSTRRIVRAMQAMVPRQDQ